jgi:hypothetical protein
MVAESTPWCWRNLRKVPALRVGPGSDTAASVVGVANVQHLGAGCVVGVE